MAENANLSLEAPEFHPAVIDKEEDGYILVSNLPTSVAEKDIVGFFQVRVGLVKSFRFFDCPFQHGPGGTARIAFCNPRDARNAFHRFNNTHNFGRKMKMTYNIVTKRKTTAVTQESNNNISSESSTVLVSKLKYYVTAKEILDYFNKAVGPVESVVFELDTSGMYEGQAKLVFRDPSDARKSLSHNDSLFHGKRIQLNLLNGRQARK